MQQGVCWLAEEGVCVTRLSKSCTENVHARTCEHLSHSIVHNTTRGGCAGTQGRMQTCCAPGCTFFCHKRTQNNTRCCIVACIAHACTSDMCVATQNPRSALPRFKGCTEQPKSITGCLAPFCRAQDNRVFSLTPCRNSSALGSQQAVLCAFWHVRRQQQQNGLLCCLLQCPPCAAPWPRVETLLDTLHTAPKVCKLCMYVLRIRTALRCGVWPAAWPNPTYAGLSDFRGSEGC